MNGWTKKQQNEIISNLNARNRLIVNIGIETGLRVTDILNLKRADILRGTWETCEHKTGKMKTCVITPETLHKARTYFKTHRSAQHLAFFNTRTKKPYTRQSVYNAIADAAEMASIANSGAHSTRATYAQNLKRNGYTIEEIREKMNHRDKKTTLVYLKNKRVTRKSDLIKRN